MIIIKKEKIKGFTLLELMIFIGVASVLSVASYMLYSAASNDKKFDTEYKNLSMVLKEVDDVTGTVGIPAGTNKSTLSKISGGLDTNLSMYDVNSPNPQRLNFVYKDVDSKTCNRFTSNMVNSAEYVSAVVNGTSVVNRENIGSLIGKCGLEKNDVTIVYNKYIDTQVIASITPDVNPVGPGIVINDKPYVTPPTINVPFTPIVTPPIPKIIVGSIINTPTYVGDPGDPILNPTITTPIPPVIPTPDPMVPPITPKPAEPNPLDPLTTKNLTCRLIMMGTKNGDANAYHYGFGNEQYNFDLTRSIAVRFSDNKVTVDRDALYSAADIIPNATQRGYAKGTMSIPSSIENSLNIAMNVGWDVTLSTSQKSFNTNFSFKDYIDMDQTKFNELNSCIVWFNGAYIWGASGA